MRRSFSYSAVAVWVAVVLLLSLRLAHINLLWADEDYHLAAAIQILHGKVPYRDFWYDKPPGSALYYLLIAGYPGWPLRILDTVYLVGACVLLSRIAARLWDPLAGLLAALLLAFYSTFDLPSAAIPFAADALMLIPHLLAVYWALAGRRFCAGAACGLAFFFNTKAVFVWLACAAFLAPALASLLLGFVAALAAGIAPLLLTHAWPSYLEQVWRWGFRYAAGSPVAHPIGNGLLRTLNWSGFHIAIVVPAVCLLLGRTRNRKALLAWVAFSYIAVGLGARFAPHYFWQLLPVIVLLGAKRLVPVFRERQSLALAALSVALLIPLIRFGPRYVDLIRANLRGKSLRWADVTMDADSQRVALLLNGRKHPGDTLLVWGYRPDIYVYTRLASDGLFWDSQPLTGVAADRHLVATTAIYQAPAAENRKRLLQTSPSWVVDGLSRFNPRLAPAQFPDLAPWFSHYKVVAQTPLSIIYRRVP